MHLTFICFKKLCLNVFDFHLILLALLNAFDFHLIKKLCLNVLDFHVILTIWLLRRRWGASNQLGTKLSRLATSSTLM